MQQHPVPQHIASYEFRLIGDMTLKQFAMLAGCCVIALLFYASGLPAYFRWPMVLFFVILGVALAFLPFEERPLHQWLIAFFKSTYAPTIFYWQKKPPALAAFEETLKTPMVSKAQEGPTLPSDREQLDQYLQSLPTQADPVAEKEAADLAKIDQLFQTTAMSTAAMATPAVAPQPVSPPVYTPPPVVPKPKPKIEPKKVYIPPPPVMSKAAPKKKEPVLEAATSAELPFPQAPTIPNLLVGMVLDNQNKIVEGAIIEIRDDQGIPVRALKTNRIGQFRIVTPLKDGVYEIETEKEGHQFDLFKLELKGKPVKPIKIKAR
jgi:hypothetical protein